MKLPVVTSDVFYAARRALAIVTVMAWSTVLGAQVLLQVGSDIVGEANGDRSGYAVALSEDGSSVAIGSPSNNSGIQMDSEVGQVRVFAWSGEAWLQRGSDIDGVARGSFFGVSVGLSADGNRLVVGAPFEEASVSGGRTRVYEWVDSDWQQLGDSLDGDAPWGDFGDAVAIAADGLHVAVGAPDDDAQFVRVFELAEGNWRQVGGDINAARPYELIGTSVALSADGNHLAVGASNSDNAAESAGTARVFRLVEGEWRQMGSDLDGRGRYDGWGISVSLSGDGNRLAVGGSEADYVRVYQWDDEGWTLLGQELQDEAGFNIGASVSLSGSGYLLAVGSPRAEVASVWDAGEVRLFEYAHGRWQQLGQPIVGDGYQARMGWGVSVSRSGNRVAGGAPQFGGGAGYTQMFDVPRTSGPVELQGRVETADGTGICAMVLASGRYMFSCNPSGPYQLSDLPRETDGTVTRQVYARGFYPNIESLPGSTDEEVVLLPARNCPDYNPPSTPMELPGSAGERVTASGTVLLGSSDTPVCALVLINGASMFSCNEQGSYSLEFPLDAKGQYALQAYAAGFAPSVLVFDERTEQVTVRMTRAAECD